MDLLKNQRLSDRAIRLWLLIRGHNGEELFKGCWAKIDRARQHRDALDSYIREYFLIEANRPRLSGELDPKSGYYVFRIASTPDLGAFLEFTSVVLGDVIHNLRSALDYLVFQLALFHTNGSIRNERALQFPIDDTPKGFERNAHRYLREVHPDHVAIIERFQPYHGTGGRPDGWSGPYIHQLALLRDLSDTDKHRLLNIILAVPNQMHFTLPAGVTFPPPSTFIGGKFSGDVLFGQAAKRVELGSEVMRSPLVGSNLPPKIDMAGDLTPSVALAEWRPIISTIDRVAAFVEQVIHDFEPLF